MRGLAGAVAALVAGLVVAGLTAPLHPAGTVQAAELEPSGDTSLTLDDVTGRITVSAVNNSSTESGQDNEDCQVYGYVSPDGVVTQTSDSQWVGSGYWSYFQRGRPGDSTGTECPGMTDASLSATSALGFRTNDPGTVQGGQTFLVGTIRHNNYQIRSSYHWVHGAINLQIGGVTESFPFSQEETDNTRVGGVPDVLTITRTTATNIVVSEDGMPYRLVLWGFVPDPDGTCPETPGDVAASDQFVTAEGETTYACLYGSFNQERTLTLTKTATADASAQDVSIPGFSYTVSPGRSLVAEDAFAPITPTGLGEQGTQSSNTVTFYAGMSDFSVAEADPGGGQDTSSGWALTAMSCLNGVGQEVDVSYDLGSGTIDFTSIAAAASVEALPVTCSYTNHYTARSTLTLVKHVEGLPEGTSADPAEWTLTAAGTDSLTSSTTVSGASGTPSVTSQVVPSGTYLLGESSPEGYQALVRSATGCVTAAGEQLEVAQDSVTLPDGADVTCTITNTAAPGTLVWGKTSASGSSLPGSEWILHGPGGAQTVVVDNGAPDEDPDDGRFRVTGLEWGTYTLEETKAPVGYNPSTETTTVTIDVSTPQATVDLGSIVNTSVTGSVTWSKVDADTPATLLSGSEWVLASPTGAEIPVTDCVEEGCAGAQADTDPAAGTFRVEDLPYGTYTLRETKAPAGYQLTSQTWSVVITEQGAVVSMSAIRNSRAAVPTGSSTGPSAGPSDSSTGSSTGPSAGPSTVPPGLPSTLPLTGSRGAVQLLAVGAVLAGLGAVLALAGRQRSQRRDMS